MTKNRLLIIDDDSDVQYMLEEICNFMEWDHVAASNGEQGVKEFIVAKPNLLLIDYHMPTMDGLTTLKTIRQMNKVVPIIILTVDERQEVANKFLAAGASDFALKPIKAPDIIARIQVHLKMIQLNNYSLQSRPNDDSSLIDETTQVQKIDPIKGISEQTLQIIVNYLSTKTEPKTMQEITDETEISYPTVNKYLNFLVESDHVELLMEYGKIGRPKNKYKIQNGALRK